MPHKFDTRLRNLLLAEERYEVLQPGVLLRSLGLRAGNTIADIGCGPGFFTIPAAEIVGPRGVVLAGDVQGEMLSAVKSRVAEHALTNVRVLKTSETDVPLPPASCDFVLLAFVLNEVESRASFLHRLGRLLRPDGRLAILEWQPIEQPIGPPVAERISPDEVLEDALSAGLQVLEQRNLNDDQYICLLGPARH